MKHFVPLGLKRNEKTGVLVVPLSVIIAQFIAISAILAVCILHFKAPLWLIVTVSILCGFTLSRMVYYPQIKRPTEEWYRKHRYN